MANNENLINGKATQFKTGEKQVEIARKGGKASGESKRRKKEMRERLEILLSMPLKDGKGADVEKIKSFGAIKGKNITVEDAILIAIAQKALKGDIPAGTFIRDTVGEKPTENQKVTIVDTDWFTE
jgi:hypothetical protein